MSSVFPVGQQKRILKLLGVFDIEYPESQRTLASSRGSQYDGCVRESDCK